MRHSQQAAMQRKEVAAGAGISDFRTVTEVTDALTKVHGKWRLTDKR